MKKTFKVTIAFTYKDIKDEDELREAILNEATAWVQSGSFDYNLECSNGNKDLVGYKVTIK